MNKKQLRNLDDIDSATSDSTVVIRHCSNCGMNKLFYGYQSKSKTILDGSTCCDDPGYLLWSYYYGVEKCSNCSKETVWFNVCYKCDKVMCDDCTDCHYVEVESEVMDFCQKCHDEVSNSEIDS